jgi:hypothetical protein
LIGISGDYNGVAFEDDNIILREGEEMDEVSAFN